MDVIPLHTTGKEIEFIDGLGSFCIDEKTGLSNKSVINRKTRKQLLRNYLIAAGLRVDWDGMDKEKILLHVRVSLLKKAA